MFLRVVNPTGLESKCEQEDDVDNDINVFMSEREREVHALLGITTDLERYCATGTVPMALKVELAESNLEAASPPTSGSSACLKPK